MGLEGEMEKKSYTYMGLEREMDQKSEDEKYHSFFTTTDD